MPQRQICLVLILLAFSVLFASITAIENRPMAFNQASGSNQTNEFSHVHKRQNQQTTGQEVPPQNDEIEQELHKNGEQIGQQSGHGNKAELDTKIMVLDYLTGEELFDEEEIAKRALVVRMNDGIVTFNAHVKVDGPAEPIKLVYAFAQEKDECSNKRNETDNGYFIILKVCKAKGKTGKCEKGAAVCYPGRLDPRNRKMDDHMALPNVNPEIASICEGSGLEWPFWKERNLNAIHTLLFSSSGDGKIKTQVSYLKEGTESANSEGSNSEQLALGDDGCVSFWVGHPKEGLYGLLSNDRAEIVFQEPDKFAFERSNGVPLRQMRLTSSMPPDFFVGSKSGDPMLAFKGSEGCELTIQIFGFLQPCQGPKPAEEPPKLEEITNLLDWIANGTGKIEIGTVVQFETNKLDVELSQNWEINGLGAKIKITREEFNKKVHSILRAQHPLPYMATNPCKLLLFYFEVDIKHISDNSQMRIGLIGASSSADWPKFKGVGGVPGSFGVGADGIFHNAGTRVENFMRESFGAGDTIGCGLFYLPWMQDVRFLFFTKNGQQLLSSSLMLNEKDIPGDLVPAASARVVDDTVKFNFGAKPFHLDLIHLKAIKL